MEKNIETELENSDYYETLNKPNAKYSKEVKFDYKNMHFEFSPDEYATIIELSKYLFVDDISEMTGVDSEVIRYIIKKSGLKEVKHLNEKDELVVWFPRALSEQVDVITLQYEKNWAKRLFKKVRKVLYSIRGNEC